MIKKLHELNENNVRTNVAAVNKASLQAIEKEMNLEAMIENEEEERERLLEEKILQEIEKEKLKKVSFTLK